MGSLRPPFRRYRGTRPARRTDARRAVRLFARYALVDCRRCVGWLCAGFCHSLLLDSPRWKIARPDGARRGQRTRRLHRTTRGAGDHDDSSRRDWARRGECPQVLSMGHLHVGDDHSHRLASGSVSALPPARARPGSFGHGSGAGSFGGRGGAVGGRFSFLVSGIYSERHSACLCHHCVWLRGVRLAGLVAARSARLSQCFHQGRRHFFSCRRHPFCSTPSLNAAAHALHRRQRPGLCRKDFPILLHYHCVWRDQRIPLVDLLRHHAEDDPSRKPRSFHRLRRHAARVVCRRDGHGRRVRHAAGCVFRD